MNPYQNVEDKMFVWTNKMATIAHKGIFMYRPDGSRSCVPLYNMEPQPDGRVLQKASNLGTVDEILGRHMKKGFTVERPPQAQIDAAMKAKGEDPVVLRAERDAAVFLAKEEQKTADDKRKEDQLNAQIQQKKRGKKK